MALVAATMKAQLNAAILAALQREFAKELAGGGPAALDTYTRIAAALSDIADVIVTQIQTQAQVVIAPGTTNVVGVCAALGTPGAVVATNARPIAGTIV